MAIETHIRDIELATNARDMREPIADAFRELNSKFDDLQIDETPIEDSTHLVESGGVYDLWNTLIDPENLLLPTDEIVTGEKVITQPGTYEASDDNLDGYSKVIVDQSVGKLDANLQPKYIYAPGEYHPEDDNCDGYSEVIIESANMDLYVPLIERTVSGKIVRTDISNVGPYAFYSCNLLSEVSFPACRQIESHAFDKCIFLSSISCFQCTLLGSKAFNDCGQLESITLGAVEFIPDYTFAGCSKLSYLNLGEIQDTNYSISSTSSIIRGMIYNIGQSAFYNCTKLKGVYKYSWTPSDDFPIDYYMPTILQNIESYAFYNCYELSASFRMRGPLESWDAEHNTSYYNLSWRDKYPYSNTHVIGECAFCNCYKLSSVDCYIAHVGNGVGLDLYSETDTDLIIGKSAFKNCFNSLSLHIESPQVHINEYAFENCLNLHLTFLGDPEVTIGSYAFKGAQFASDYGIYFAEHIVYTTYIGKYAFQSCNAGGTFISPPRSAAHCIIDEYAFDHNYALTTFTLTKHEIMPMAFANCENLSRVTLSAGNIIHSNAFYNCFNLTSLLISGFSQPSELIMDSDALANTAFAAYDVNTSEIIPKIIIRSPYVNMYWSDWLNHTGLSQYSSFCYSSTDY